VSAGVMLDYDADGRLIGIEILDVRSLMSEDRHAAEASQAKGA
jgi:uncharacterized protein YuzE